MVIRLEDRMTLQNNQWAGAGEAGGPRDKAVRQISCIRPLVNKKRERVFNNIEKYFQHHS